MTIPYFFKNCRLKKLICEPYAFNTAPNKTLPKIGFEYIKTHRTVPGVVSSEQDVCLWELSTERFNKLFR